MMNNEFWHPNTIDAHAICLICGEVYDTAYIDMHTKESGYCPKIICGGKLITCDDMIMSAVYMLNRRGYTTFHSCSGHPGGRMDSTYISFSCDPAKIMEVVRFIIKPYGEICFNVAIGPMNDYDLEDILRDKAFYGTTTRAVNHKTLSPSIIEQFERIASDAESNRSNVIVVVRPDESLMQLDSYPIIGAGHELLTEVNEALYKMAESLPDLYAES